MGRKKKQQDNENDDFSMESDVYDEVKSEATKPLKLVLRVGGVGGPPSQDSGDAEESMGEDDEDAVAAADAQEVQQPYLLHKKHKKKRKHKHHESKHGHSEEKRKKTAFADDSHASDCDSVVESVTMDKVESEVPVPLVLAPVSSDQTTSVAKRALFNEKDSSLVRSLRERAAEDDSSSLRKCLDYFHGAIQRKDTNAFFAYPVTDQIAPGYSSIINRPMDFSTMTSKVENGQYSNLASYKADVKQICDNCMLYNQEETVYYKEAMKLWIFTSKLLSKENVQRLVKNVPALSNMTEEQLGLDELNHITALKSAEIESVLDKMNVKQRKAISRFDAVPDRLSAEEILAQARKAAEGAAEQLTLRKPNSRMGFLRQRDDGSTTFSFLNPDNSGTVSETERVVTIGQLVGRLPHGAGAGTLAGFREDKRNKASPVSYMNYGAFSSYAPVYDSTTANLSKEDSDLLLSTYGDESSLQYAQSIQQFVANSGDYAIKMVDDLLDLLTGGEHSKTKSTIADHEASKKAEEETSSAPSVHATASVPDTTQSVAGVADSTPPVAGSSDSVSDGDVAPEVSAPVVNVDSLRSLSDIGIDVSFLKDFGEGGEVQQQLDRTGAMLEELHSAQYERHSQPPPPHLSLLPGPSDREVELASKIRSELVSMVKEVPPGSLVSAEAVHSAMGIAASGGVERQEEAVNEEQSLAPVDDMDFTDTFTGNLADFYKDASPEATPLADTDEPELIL